MQLSVATTPTEPNLAALLLGGIASTTPGQPTTAAGENTAPFAQLFPDLAPGASAPNTSGIAPPAVAAIAPTAANGTPLAITMGNFPSSFTASLAGAPRSSASAEAGSPALGEPKKFFRGTPAMPASDRRGANSRLESVRNTDETSSAPALTDVAVAVIAPPTAVPPAPESCEVETDTVAAPDARENFAARTEEGGSLPVSATASVQSPTIAVPASATEGGRAGQHLWAGSSLPAFAAPSEISSLPRTNASPANPRFPIATQASGAIALPAATEEISPSAVPLTLPVASRAPGAPRFVAPILPRESGVTVATSAEIHAPLAVASDAVPAETDSRAPQSPVVAATELNQLFSAGDAPSVNLVESAGVASTASQRATSREEKFAARDEKNSGEKISARTASPKTFLNAEEKRVTLRDSDLGIDVAKSTPAMSAPNFSNRPAPVAAPLHLAIAAVASTPAEPVTSGAQILASDAPAAAQRAVEAVLNAAESFSAGDRHSVNLHFSVGGADLAVRVELRADEVRTTFRTDSAELRTALAHEWQAVNTDAAERPLRLATPVFASNSSDAANLSAFTGDSASRQRDSGAQRAAEEVFGSIASRVRTAASAAEEIVSPTTRLAALPTALHLHTLA